MTWRGQQIPVDDVVVESGTLDPYSDILNGIATRGDSNTVTIGPGDQFYVYMRGLNPSIDPTDVVALESFRFNASGHGQLDLQMSVDPDWSYSPPFTWTDLPRLTVDTDTLALTSTPCPLHTHEELNADSGPILLRVTGISGSVTLEWLALQVEPPGGLQAITRGHWSDYAEPDLVDLPAADAKSVEYNVSHTEDFASTHIYLQPDAPDHITAVVGAVQADLPDATPTVTALTGTGAQTALGIHMIRAFVTNSSTATEGTSRTITAHAASWMAFTSFDWADYPDHRDYPPGFFTGKTLDEDYTVIPGKESDFSYARYIDFAEGDTESIEWAQIVLLGSPTFPGASATEHYGTGEIDDTAEFGISSGRWDVGDPMPTFDSVLDTFDTDPRTYTSGETSTHYSQWIVFDESWIGLGFTPVAGTGFKFLARSPLAFDGEIPPPDYYTGSPAGGDGWATFIFGQENHGRQYTAQGRMVKIRAQMPNFRYWIPEWGLSPDSLGTTVVSWVQWRQRPDSLGFGTYRNLAHESVQESNRWLGVR